MASGESKKRDCVSRRHHYVPQAYLQACSRESKGAPSVLTRCPQTLNASTPIDGIEAFELLRRVELRGLEPLTPTLPVWCATSCATAPYLVRASAQRARHLRNGTRIS